MTWCIQFANKFLCCRIHLKTNFFVSHLSSVPCASLRMSLSNRVVVQRPHRATEAVGAAAAAAEAQKAAAAAAAVAAAVAARAGALLERLRASRTPPPWWSCVS